MESVIEFDQERCRTIQGPVADWLEYVGLGGAMVQSFSIDLERSEARLFVYKIVDGLPKYESHKGFRIFDLQMMILPGIDVPEFVRIVGLAPCGHADEDSAGGRCLACAKEGGTRP